MAAGKDFVINFGLFLIMVGLAIYVPNIDNMLIDLSAASENVQLLFKVAFLVIGFGFLFNLIEEEARW